MILTQLASHLPGINLDPDLIAYANLNSKLIKTKSFNLKLKSKTKILL